MVTTRVTEVVLVNPPPLPEIVTFLVPSEAFALTVMVRMEVPAPGAASGFGLNVTVCRGPCPVADNVIAELNPPAADVVTV